MNPSEMARIMREVRESFLDLVSPRQVQAAGDAGVYLFNHVLQRGLTIWDAEDWPIVRDCWLTCLDKPLVEPVPMKPRNCKNLWVFWH